MTARRFNRAKFMAELKIRPEAMPLLASAVGNDFVGQARPPPARTRVPPPPHRCPAFPAAATAEAPSFS